MFTIDSNFKKTHKILTKIETVIIPNVAKTVMNQAINQVNKEAAKALKKRFKSVNHPKEKTS